MNFLAALPGFILNNNWEWSAKYYYCIINSIHTLVRESDICKHMYSDPVLSYCCSVFELWAQVWVGLQLPGKAEYSGSLMKRDSEVCWSGMSLLLVQDLSPQPGRRPVIENCCWSIVKLQLNSFSIIITICFPYRCRDENRHRRGRGARQVFFSSIICCLSLMLWLFWWPLHHDFTSSLILAIGHIWHVVPSKPKPVLQGATRTSSSKFHFLFLLSSYNFTVSSGRISKVGFSFIGL